MIERAVIDFLNSLGRAERRQAMFSFASGERFDWHYIPKERKGLALAAMSEAQRHLAKSILRAALSERGYSRTEEIMQLDAILAEMEQDHETYGPLNYVFTIFGQPGNGAPWGWRVDGHHLSLNFSHAPDGVSVTPIFYGANPATVEQGPLQGLRVLGGEEDLGRELIRSLDADERGTAIIRHAAFEDILTGPGRETSLKRSLGLALGQMSEGHRALALRIIEEFVGTLKPSLAEAERTRLRAAGIERIHFAWAGALEPRQPHYYRLHGPNLVIEYDNTQNDANHIHSVWHDPTRDFGGDLLGRHYEHASHRRHAAAHHH
jgi:hypothetical protein